MNVKSTRVLSKSRFKLGLECPNKLFYTAKETYVNTKSDDPFLLALAAGGFQVEELARMHYPGGELIDGPGHEYEALALRTAELLQQENVVIYEAAFLYDSLFVRTDIVVKTGNRVQLIEVKAKSFDPKDDYMFFGKRGGLNNDWLPYLFDLAFQTHVARKAAPQLTFIPHLMLADKSKHASMDGLNQLFRISRTGDKRTGISRLVNSLEETGDSVLTALPMQAIVEDILQGEHVHHGRTFLQWVNELREYYINDAFAHADTRLSMCKNCEFHAHPLPEGKLSGKAHCFARKHTMTPDDLLKPWVSDVWNWKSAQRLWDEGKRFMSELTAEDFNVDAHGQGKAHALRQWLQVQCEQEGRTTPVIDRDGLQEERAKWVYPYHFIDFETSMVALPFMAGRRPYEQISFQFSHHIMYADGRVEHANQILLADPGFFPNFDFVRALRDALGTTGSIFRFSNHENSVLRQIADQLSVSEEPDREELIEFIRSITKSGKDSPDPYVGERCMIDLRDVVINYYYHPATKGSNSIKALLPAIISSSEFLQQKYSQPIASHGVTSLNLPDSHVWLTQTNGEWNNPYKGLPSVFEGWTEDELEANLSEMDNLADGGAALTAYGRLQYTDMTDEERQALISALYRYCELDTLAMVMLVEGMGEF
jgi:hypothetical protein